jgi:predicted RNA binding protein YcfA (HicA-like mRNA interferase family)
MKVLRRAPLRYEVVRQGGGHRVLEAEGRGRVVMTHHDSQTLPSGVVRRILVDQAGLSEDEARALL